MIDVNLNCFKLNIFTFSRDVNKPSDFRIFSKNTEVKSMLKYSKRLSKICSMDVLPTHLDRRVATRCNIIRYKIDEKKVEQFSILCYIVGKLKFMNENVN
jgi:hypothetical protein